MALTYNGTLTTNLDRVRFYIGDQATSSGPKPAGANFTDAEITGLVTLEGSWQRTVAACFEMLAGLWAANTNFSADGVSVSQSDTAKMYAAQALDWRKRFGTASTNSVGSRAPTRTDGYSDDIDSSET
jgi:hypothetical protein